MIAGAGPAEPVAETYLAPVVFLNRAKVRSSAGLVTARWVM